MSIYSDYSHNILHHQTERELIRQAEQNRLAREARGLEPRVVWWRRLSHREPWRVDTRRRQVAERLAS
jgi:hypothetical protein